LSVVHHGTGLLRATYHADEEGVILGVVSSSPFYDAEREAQCTPTRTEGGTLRCLPDFSLADEEVFSDPDCSERLLTGPVRAELYGIGRRTACYSYAPLEVLDLVRGGAVYEGEVYVRSGSECFEGGRSAGVIYVTRGESVLDQYPELAERAE
jgi:hypothetical protein